MPSPPPPNRIVPFWERLREIARYPAHPAALTTIAVLALCHLLHWLPFGFVVDLLVWVGLYTYAFECLRASANGRLEPPEFAATVEGSLGWAQIALQIVFVALNFLGFVLLGPTGGLVVAIALALALPGAIMSLAMDENLAHALNPATWLAILTRIGWPYVAAAALYFAFNLSQRYAQAAIVPFLPPVVAEVAFYFIAHYVVVATFHLMGYLIYQYHDEVGYEPAPPPRPRGATDDPDQALLDEAAALVREGRPDEAVDRLGAQLRARGGSETAHAQYRKLLALVGRRDERLRHGREWIGILLAQDEDRRAVEVARECVELDPAFQPAAPEQVTRLAAKAAEANATDLALRLVSGFHKRHPKHRDIPTNYLLAAKLLVERKGRDAEARALLDGLARTYPEHPLAAEIAAYRRFVDTLAAPAGAKPG
ncbi:MAG TPA: hypothetical protein VGC30_09030 [Dokdonella sp.]